MENLICVDYHEYYDQEGTHVIERICVPASELDIEDDEVPTTASVRRGLRALNRK